jgi:hypothetical protein
MGFFDDNPPIEFNRGSRGWLKPKGNATKKQVRLIQQENTELKSRLEQLEAMVEQLVSKKKK